MDVDMTWRNYLARGFSSAIGQFSSSMALTTIIRFVAGILTDLFVICQLVIKGTADT